MLRNTFAVISLKNIRKPQMFFHQNKNTEFQYKSFNFHLINLDIYVYHTIIITIILQNF